MPDRPLLNHGGAHDVMDRRNFIHAVTLSLLALPGAAAHAQSAGGKPRIAVLGLTPANQSLSEAFQRGLGELGYTDGRNVTIEYVDADGKPERLPQFAADIVRGKVDV